MKAVPLGRKTVGSRWVHGHKSDELGKGKTVRLLKCQYGLKQAEREGHLLLVRWLVKSMRMEQCKAESCIFRQMVSYKVSLRVVLHGDDTMVSEKSKVFDKIILELKERFPVKHQGELKMYIDCAYEYDWENRIQGVNQKAFAENKITQYVITAVFNIPVSPGVDC